MPIFTMYMYPVCNLHMVTYVYCVTRNFVIHILNVYRIHETLLVKSNQIYIFRKQSIHTLFCHHSFLPIYIYIHINWSYTHSISYFIFYWHLKRICWEILTLVSLADSNPSAPIISFYCIWFQCRGDIRICKQTISAKSKPCIFENSLTPIDGLV